MHQCCSQKIIYSSALNKSPFPPFTVIRMLKTSNNQRLGSVFDDLDPRLSLLFQVGDNVICSYKIPEDAKYMSQDPFIHTLNQSCPIQSLGTFVKSKFV